MRISKVCAFVSPGAEIKLRLWLAPTRPRLVRETARVEERENSPNLTAERITSELAFCLFL